MKDRLGKYIIYYVFFSIYRKREEDLAKAHQKEVDSMAADHLRETQSLLTEFNRSKELLSDKISALQLMWVVAENTDIPCYLSVRGFLCTWETSNTIHKLKKDWFLTGNSLYLCLFQYNDLVKGQSWN